MAARDVRVMRMRDPRETSRFNPITIAATKHAVCQEALAGRVGNVSSWPWGCAVAMSGRACRTTWKAR
jgi:hypothetical protein